MIPDSTRLDGRQRVDQVRELRSSRSPAHSKDAVITTAVSEAVRSVQRRARVVADNNDGAWLEQGQCTVVLQQDGTGSANFPDDLEMIVLDVNMLVCSFVEREECIEVNCKEASA